MRKVLPGAVIIGVFMALLTLPALAAAGPAYVPPNEAALMQALIKSGRIPRAASPADQEAMLNAYLRQELGSKPEDRVGAGRIASDVALRGRTSWGRAIALDPGVTTDNALVILVEFDTEDYTSPDFPDVFPGGPLHGEIPAPPPGDNTTFWPGPGDKGFGTTHYQQMLFGASFPIYDESGKLRGTSSETMRNHYLEMSKGTYKLTGQIKDWVKVPYPEAWYGRDDADGNGHPAVPAWQVALDAVKAFQAADPDFDWTVYDQKNPFGIAGDDPGIPDGYVDHLILVHAGVDASAGGGAQGADAIWAHSGWVDSANGEGPGEDGGYQVATGTSTSRPDGIWVGPYVIQPEDGGIGVFCHEFGHDLGLPDEYDTTYTGDSPSTFWTLMAGGSWLGKKWGMGTRPAPMNVADKTMLGFITPREVAVGAEATIRLKPAATGKAGDVAVKVELPAKYREIVLSGKDDAHNPESGREEATASTSSGRCGTHRATPLSRSACPHPAAPSRSTRGTRSRTSTTTASWTSPPTVERPGSRSPAITPSTRPRGARASAARAVAASPAPTSPPGRRRPTRSTPTPARRCRCASATSPTAA